MQPLFSKELSKEILDNKRFFRAIAHPLRQQMLEFINEQQETNVGKIAKAFDIEQSIASQHLAVLRQIYLVNDRRDGKYIYYSINNEEMNNGIEWIQSRTVVNVD